MASQDSLLKVYGDRSYRHVTMARHQGTTIAFAMDASRRVVYSVLDLSGPPAKGEADTAYWSENPAELPFPRELAEVGHAVAGATLIPTVKRGGAEAAAAERPTAVETDPFLSTTARLTADTPFHVISDGTYVVVLRQSVNETHPDAVFKLTGGGSSGDASRNDYVLSGTKKVPLVRDTLLCDRFLLVDGKLKPVLEVRYKRSRHATLPESAKDSLGTEDMEGRPFYEPTQELSFVRNLTQGRFAAVLVPTAISGVQRWQLFAHNDATGRIDSFSIEQGAQGLFNTQGTRFYTSPDPLHRDAVFERNPGNCPFTGRELVPVTGSGGQAETELRLAGTDPHVDLGDPAALRFGGKPYSIEAWVKPAELDGPVLARGAAYQLALSPDGTVYLAHNANPWLISSSDKISKDVYSHIAATFDGQTARVYVNGSLSGSGDMPFVDEAGAVTLIGKKVHQGRTIGYFKGAVDEVRIWNRVRSATELTEDMNHRLIGNEPGLVAYYRFDEGTGTTAYDQTDNALHGTLSADVQWTGSDAPVGDHPGVRRDSFVLKGRSVVSGMSAVLYHQQENAVAGYRPDPKPAKRQARVMLAFSAKYGQNPCLASLDFAVGRDGRLAQAPDVLDPAVLKRPAKGQDSEQISALQQVIRRLEPEVDALPPEIARRDATAGTVAERQAEHDRLKASFEDLERRYLAEKDLVTSWIYNVDLKTPRVVKDATVQRLYAVPSSSNEARVLLVPASTTGQWMTWRVEAVSDSQDGRPCYLLVSHDRNADLRVAGDSTAENAQLVTVLSREWSNPSEQFQLVFEGEYVRIVNRRSRLAIGLPSAAQNQIPVQSSEHLKADSGLFRLTRLSMRYGLDVHYVAAKGKMDAARALLQEARTAKQRVAELQLTLTAKPEDFKSSETVVTL